jgi:hypothetical protein
MVYSLVRARIGVTTRVSDWQWHRHCYLARVHKNRHRELQNLDATQRSPRGKCSKFSRADAGTSRARRQEKRLLLVYGTLARLSPGSHKFFSFRTSSFLATALIHVPFLNTTGRSPKGTHTHPWPVLERSNSVCRCTSWPEARAKGTALANSRDSELERR